jgi:hypothetical protein
MLDVAGGTGVDGVDVEDGLITVTDVLVSVVVDPPGIELMSVTIVLDVSGEIDMGVDLVVNIEGLALAGDDPPGVLLVDDERPLGVGSAVEPIELKDPPTTVVEMVVKVVVCPPDIVLISVTGMVEVVGVSELPIVREVTPPMVVEVTLVRVEGWLTDIAVVVVAELEATVWDWLGRVLDDNVDDEVGVLLLSRFEELKTPVDPVVWLGLVLEDQDDEEDTAIEVLANDTATLEVSDGMLEVGIEVEGGPVEGLLDSELAGSDEIAGVISGVLVGRVLNRLGGATLFIHSVVPFTTEK